MRLTGTMRIELTDVNTGEVTAVTEENMVTDAVNHILGLNPVGVFYEIGESIDGEMAGGITSDLPLHDWGNSAVFQGTGEKGGHLFPVR